MNLDLLRELCETPGPPGREDKIREIVRREIGPMCESTEVDNIGNLIGRKKGQGGPKLMISGHMDEIAFAVTHIDDDGFIRFTTLGGFDPKTLTAQRVVVHGRKDLIGVMGMKPVHLLSEEEKRKAPKLEDFFIDLGLPKDKVVEEVSIGDSITCQREYVDLGESICAKAFDDRLGVFVMIEALKKSKEHVVEVYAVASAQEEVGIRGALVAARNIDPEIGIALDVTVANDVPEAKAHERVTRMGKGAAIKVMDSSVVCNPKLVAALKRIAENRGIPYQMEVLTKGGTDTSAIQRAGKGAAAGCISIPTRYIHSVTEMCSKEDLQAAIDLLAAFVEEAHAENYRPF